MAETRKTAAKKSADQAKTPSKKPVAKKAAAKPGAKTAKKAAPQKPLQKAGGGAQEGRVGNEKALENAGKNAPIRPTVSHMLGEIVWLLSQSQAHRHFSISDLDWMVAPAIANSQYRVFRAGKKPVGVALWAQVNDEANTRLTSGTGRLRPNEWKSGPHCWLIEVISPFSTAENKLTEAMFNDLVKGPLKGKTFRFSKVNPQTGKREVAEFKPNQAR